jgi:hypothetical protein
MSSKELAIKTKIKEVTLPDKVYNTGVDKVTAETHYRTPFKPYWLQNVAQSKSVLKDDLWVGATGLLGGGTAWLLGDGMLFGFGTLNLGLAIPFMIAGGAPSFFLYRNITRRTEAKYFKAKQITKEHLAKWLAARYSLELEDSEIEKVVDHIAYLHHIKSDLDFTSNNGELYTLKKNSNTAWYVVPYVTPIDLEKDEQLAYTPTLTKVIEVKITNKFTDEQQSMHDTIVSKLRIFKNLELDTEKTFSINRIDKDLKEISKLNNYGNSLSVSGYDSSKITTILTLLDNELNVVFKDELQDLSSNLDAKIELITNRTPHNR